MRTEVDVDELDILVDGEYWMACPIHGTSSVGVAVRIEDGKLSARCEGGCDSERLIRAIQARNREVTVACA